MKSCNAVVCPDHLGYRPELIESWRLVPCVGGDGGEGDGVPSGRTAPETLSAAGSRSSGSPWWLGWPSSFASLLGASPYSRSVGHDRRNPGRRGEHGGPPRA